MGKFKGKTAIILTASNHQQALYIDGSLYDDNFMYNSDDPFYLLRLADDLNFTSADTSVHELSDIDEKLVSEREFPGRIEKLNDYLEYIK